MNSVKTILTPWVTKRAGGDKKAMARYHKTMRENILAYTIKKSVFYRGYSRYAREDWDAIPFTTHEDLRTRGMEMLCTSQGDIERIVTLETSGTTGLPKRIFFTALDQQQIIEYFRVGMDTFTALGDKVLIMLPGERQGSIGELLFQALESSSKVPKHHGVVKNLGHTFECIEKAQPDVLVGIPAQIFCLAKYGDYHNKRMASVKKVLLSTDRASEAGVKELQRLWQCEVYRYYGMTEAGFGGGIECGHHQGYHVYESDFYVEIINAHTGAVLPEGENGEVVITTLKREGMPLIRYRTGDISRIIPEPCPCGSSLKRLDEIKSRLKGSVQLKAGELLTKGQLDDALLGMAGLMDYTVNFEKTQTSDRLNIEAVFLGNEPEPAKVLKQLSQIKALEKALTLGTLKANICTKQGGSDYCPHPGKRMITISS